MLDPALDSHGRALSAAGVGAEHRRSLQAASRKRHRILLGMQDHPILCLAVLQPSLTVLDAAGKPVVRNAQYPPLVIEDRSADLGTWIFAQDRCVLGQLQSPVPKAVFFETKIRGHIQPRAVFPQRLISQRLPKRFRPPQVAPLNLPSLLRDLDLSVQKSPVGRQKKSSSLEATPPARRRGLP